VDNYFEPNTGMKSVDRKLAEFNQDHKWLDYRFAQKADEHILRMRALYNGGDCYIVGFPNARPNDRLWTVGRNLRNNVFWNVYVSLEVLVDRARVKHGRKHERIGIIPAVFVRHIILVNYPDLLSTTELECGIIRFHHSIGACSMRRKELE